MEKEKTVAKAVEFIEQNLNKALTLEDIANHANYSKFHLNRIFSEIAGTTIHKYIQTRRLAEAAGKLSATDLPIIEIAYDAGYNSQQAFTHAFRQAYGAAPQAYRAGKQLRPATIINSRGVAA